MPTGDISSVIVAKSDQLNACDLFAGPITVQVTKVNVTPSDQPVSVYIGEDRQPFKPCLGMRRVMAKLWGKFSSEWVGKSMTLYCDDSVMWAGKPVGGIRISHMSNIDSKQVVTIRASKHSTVNYEITPLSVDLPPYSDDDIETNKAAWMDAFETEGDQAKLITRIKRKFTLTPDQEERILQMSAHSI